MRAAANLPNRGISHEYQLQRPGAPRGASSFWRSSALGRAAVLRAADPEPDGARVSAGLTPEGGRIVVEAKGVPAPVPLFFTAAVDESVRLGAAEIAGEMRLRLHVVQGRPEALSLGLSGDGDVTEVSGAGLRDWSVRQASGKRLLDIRPSLSDGAAGPRDLDLVVRTRLQRPAVPGATAVLIAAPGDAVGFVSNISLVADPDVDLRVTSVTGLVALGDKNGAGGATQFVSTGEGRIEAALERRGAGPADADLVGAQLTGTVSGTGAGVDFRLRGQLRSAKAGARLRVLSGRAALSDGTAGDGWHAELVALEGGRFGYDLVAERAGAAPVDLAFAAQVRERGDWRTIDFSMPAGSAVPVRLEGLGTEVEFNRDSPIVPAASRGAWQGFLPADGSASLSWRPTRAAEMGALAFTSSEQTDVRVGAGLLRQSSRLTLRVLQGKLAGVRCRLEGPGRSSASPGRTSSGGRLSPTGRPGFWRSGSAGRSRPRARSR